MQLVNSTRPKAANGSNKKSSEQEETERTELERHYPPFSLLPPVKKLRTLRTFELLIAKRALRPQRRFFRKKATEQFFLSVLCDLWLGNTACIFPIMPLPPHISLFPRIAGC